MITFGGGRRPRLVGCLPLLLVAVAVSLLVFAISGGSCFVFFFP
jgi:hypothetical protein